MSIFSRWRAHRAALSEHPASALRPVDAVARLTQRLSGAAHFDGSTDGFDVAADTAFNWGPDGSFSVACWLRTDARIRRRPSQVAVGRDEWSRPGGSGMHWWLGLWGKGLKTPHLTGKAAFVLRDKQGHAVVVTGRRRLDDCRWHHLAAVRDAAAGQALLYIDGKPEAGAEAVFAADFDSSVSPLNVGWLNHAMHGGKNNYYRFRGTLDEVLICNHVLVPKPGAQHAVR